MKRDIFYSTVKKAPRHHCSVCKVLESDGEKGNTSDHMTEHRLLPWIPVYQAWSRGHLAGQYVCWVGLNEKQTNKTKPAYSVTAGSKMFKEEKEDEDALRLQNQDAVL